MIALMRKVIRNNYLYRILLWSFLIMMAVGGGIAVNLGQEKNWVIKVYDKLLDENKFQQMMKMAKRQEEEFRQRGIVIAGKDVEKDTVVDGVASLLTDHAMDALTLQVPDQVVDKAMQEMIGSFPAHYFKDGQLNIELFKRAIAPNTMEDVLESICETSKSKMFLNIVDLGIYTPHFELALAYNADFANKEYSVLTLPLSNFIAQSKKEAVSDASLEKFYKKSKNNVPFKTAEQRAGSVWKFSQANYQVKISDSEVKNYYEAHKQQYLLSPSEVQVRLLLIKAEPGKETEAKQKIESLKDQADKNPKEFAKLVKEFSQDADAATKGGLTKPFAQDSKNYDNVLIKTAFEALSKDDQVSDPIKTSRGYELVQRVKRTPAKYKELKTVESDIRKNLEAVKFKQRFKQDATRVVNQAKYNTEVLNAFIERHKAQKQEIPLDSLGSGVVSNQLFKTEDQRYSTFFDGADGMILLTTEVVKSKVPPLSEVKSKVLDAFHKEQAHTLLEKSTKSALSDSKEMTLEEVAKKYSGSVSKASFEYKNGSVTETPLLKTQAIQSKIKGLQRPGAVTEVVTDTDGYVIKLESMQERNEKLFEEKQQSLSKTSFYEKKYKLKEAFVASLYRHAKLDNKIEMKDSILQLIKKP